MHPANNLTRDEARRRAELIHTPLYEISLDLTQDSDTFACEATIHFLCHEPGTDSFIDFLAPSVNSCELNGEEVEREAFDGARIVLKNLREANELHIIGTCRYENIGSGLSKFRDPVDQKIYLHSQFETFNAHRVFPCFDQPDLKASFTFSVLAPSDWVVVSNNPGQAQQLAGRENIKRWTFGASPKMSSYLAAIIAGPYHGVRDRHGDIDLGIFCRQSLAQYLDPDEIFTLTKQGLDFYGEAYKYPYPFQKYDQLFVPEFSAGAMENIGAVTFHESFIFRSKVTEAAREDRANVILHEMAHMWFGDLVTMRWWDDLWLNESFATFMSVFSQVEATRFKNGWVTFANQYKTGARRQDQLPTTHPISADIPDIESVYLNFDAITYNKGACVLRQLVAYVGQETFLRGVQRYIKQLASLAIRQEAPPDHPTIRPHRLAVGLYDRNSSHLELRKSVELDVVEATTPVTELSGEPAAQLLLLNDRDLTYAKIRLDERSLTTATGHLAELSDPLARALVWAALWDMLRDAELPARRYLPLILNNIHGETDIGVVQDLLGQASSSIWVYGDPANARASLEMLAQHSLRTLDAAAPGSDFQLAWAHAFIGAARSPEHLSIVRGLLDGIKVFTGLKVDTDLRWAIVGALAGVGADDGLIDAELKRDPTDEGQRHAAAARAARPTPEAKEMVWAALMEDKALPLATMRAVMGGFSRFDQRRLLEPYGARYFRALNAIWKERDIEVALAFGRMMFPTVLVGEETVMATDEYLGGDQVPGPIRRILVEGKDNMQRAMRGRALDAAVEPVAAQR
ncbi:MAG: aminopeptidase N [Chloroflexi bacterium]|nr:MAG: aminopeptidase N [Chloroflexota bacterium]